jgi:hypothetical protein
VGTAEELARARGRIAILEERLRAATGREEASSTRRQPDPGRYTSPSAETLRDMAEKCWVAYDLPPVSVEERPVLVDEKLAAVASLTGEEQRAVNEAYRQVHDRYLDVLRRLYVEVSGDAAGATQLSSEAMEKEIVRKSPKVDELEARRRISRERAGLESPRADPAQGSAVERLLRSRMNLGREAEAAAASVVGAKRAHTLRAHDGVGWRNSVSDHGGCTDER